MRTWVISTRVLIYSQSPHARSPGGVRRFRLGRAARQQRHRAHLRVTRYDANLQFTRPSPFARRRVSISHMCVLYPRSGALLGPPEQLSGMHRADVARHIRGLGVPIPTHVWKKERTHTHIHPHTHTDTHTYVYIYIYII